MLGDVLQQRSAAASDVAAADLSPAVAGAGGLASLL